MKYSLILAGILSLFLGCVSNSPHSEFVKSITFSSLETFSFKRTLVTGTDFRSSEEQLLENMSEEVSSAQFVARGFDQVDSGGDFYVVVKWRKAVSSYPDIFDSIDGPLEAMQRRDNPSYQFATRLNLTVEVYESSTDKMFWRKELPNIFDAVQLTEERVSESLERALNNFPERVEKDPNLPDIR